MSRRAESLRKVIAEQTPRAHKSLLGQFMTPTSIARFMASLFRTAAPFEGISILDAGAGVGALTSAYLDRLSSAGDKATPVRVTTFEIDERLRPHLQEVLNEHRSHLKLAFDIFSSDFVDIATEQVVRNEQPFSHAILNPPYNKIGSGSWYRNQLSRAGIETVNLYAGFVALALLLLKPHGELVVIVPRSFCNGPYYLPFRRLLLANSSLVRMHLFAARDKAFKDDSVLQETIVLHVVRAEQQGDVVVSTSSDDTFSDLEASTFSFDKIVKPNDAQRFIHVPTDGEADKIDLWSRTTSQLGELGLEVSTGPVVDFRLQHDLRHIPADDSVPLLYPTHFSAGRLEWPLIGGKKPNAIAVNANTSKWLFPPGCYVVVRRFSSKEENRRVVASVVEPAELGNPSSIAFENHLNVFHSRRRGLPKTLAHGLVTYLNSTAVDEHFRRFSGHTQVNATDLRNMRYPSLDDLNKLGAWSLRQAEFNQKSLDSFAEELLCA